MKILLKGLICLFLCISFGCSNKKDLTKAQPLIISPKYFQSVNYSLSDFCEDIKYVKIDSKYLIGRIINVKFLDSLIIMSTIPEGILVSNEKGEIIRKIGKRGNGPGEYKYGFSFSLDKNNKVIYINDNAKILVYHINGKLLRELKVSDGTVSKLIYNNHKLYDFKHLDFNNLIGNKTKSYVFDTLGQLIHSEKFNPIDGFRKKVDGVIASNNTYFYDNHIHYWNQFNDTVYKIIDKTYVAKYYFNDDEFRLRPELTVSKDNFGQNSYYLPLRLLESENFFFMYYMQYGHESFCIYNKSNGAFQSTQINKLTSTIHIPDTFTGIKNNIDGGVYLNPTTINFSYSKINSKEYFIQTISALEIKEHVKSEKFLKIKVKYPGKKEAFIKLSSSLNENDNPVLMLVRLKQ